MNSAIIELIGGAGSLARKHFEGGTLSETGKSLLQEAIEDVFKRLHLDKNLSLSGFIGYVVRLFSAMPPGAYTVASSFAGSAVEKNKFLQKRFGLLAPLLGVFLRGAGRGIHLNLSELDKKKKRLDSKKFEGSLRKELMSVGVDASKYGDDGVETEEIHFFDAIPPEKVPHFVGTFWALMDYMAFDPDQDMTNAQAKRFVGLDGIAFRAYAAFRQMAREQPKGFVNHLKDDVTFDQARTEPMEYSKEIIALAMSMADESTLNSTLDVFDGMIDLHDTRKKISDAASDVLKGTTRFVNNVRENGIEMPDPRDAAVSFLSGMGIGLAATIAFIVLPIFAVVGLSTGLFGFIALSSGSSMSGSLCGASITSFIIVAVIFGGGYRWYLSGRPASDVDTATDTETDTETDTDSNGEPDAEAV